MHWEEFYKTQGRIYKGNKKVNVVIWKWTQKAMMKMETIIVYTELALNNVWKYL
jgi:hypothetical protein